MTRSPMLEMMKAATMPAMNTAIDLPTLSCCPALMASNTMTAARAPMGSSSVLSHCSTLRTRVLGRTNVSNGLTTVGPDTTTMAPISSAMENGMPMTTPASTAALAHVMAPPNHTRSSTVRPSRLSMRRLPSSMPPWNRMMATTRSTTGLKAVPRMPMGLAPGTKMPSTNPAGSSSTSEGTRRRGAITWQTVATAKMRAIPRTTWFWVRTGVEDTPRRYQHAEAVNVG